MIILYQSIFSYEYRTVFRISHWFSHILPVPSLPNPLPRLCWPAVPGPQSCQHKQPNRSRLLRGEKLKVSTAKP